MYHLHGVRAWTWWRGVGGSTPNFWDGRGGCWEGKWEKESERTRKRGEAICLWIRCHMVLCQLDCCTQCQWAVVLDLDLMFPPVIMRQTAPAPPHPQHCWCHNPQSGATCERYPVAGQTQRVGHPHLAEADLMDDHCSRLPSAYQFSACSASRALKRWACSTCRFRMVCW